MSRSGASGASASASGGAEKLNQRLESTLATLKALDELANAEVPNNAEIRRSLDILTSNLDHLQRAAPGLPQGAAATVGRKL